MQAVTNAIRLIVPLSLLALTGCFSLGRGEPPQRHYVLGAGMHPADAATPAPAGDVPGIAIGLRQPRLAQYLETPFMVIRRGVNQIELSEFHRWGETLEQGINRTVAGYLAANKPVGRVEFAPWPPRTHLDYVIQLHVLRFEGSVPDDAAATEGEALVQATWEILRGEDGVVLTRGTTEYRQGGWSLEDYDSLVSLLQEGLSVLAHELATGLKSVMVP
jgi:uncharacterized protein